MKRSWLIGAALVFSLSSVVGCSDDDDNDDVVTPVDSGLKDGGPNVVIDSGLDSGLDATVTKPDAGDAG